ncbi:uncharacterized protein PGTG_13338 [Puccinia graminis f. sp. tritici CRL 75-36-700-3]|uniref:Uncharacterized protein n=1 Tax=Puccinia graminis f. sp. tritici (strain CRL 75-36-700-3 / race SCCL) TaxID=418459 RepID=E3KS44_PUCGT|nr:uncharacterized protein PGTG_13338 [Puccinia graminis f. sp. tritici CRL 75-36-700-3]EFP87119.2 hypothetical protein PGTG_13338 [Puccinia graminis f. sp. tritici CRL 75-36-700-3]
MSAQYAVRSPQSAVRSPQSAVRSPQQPAPLHPSRIQLPTPSRLRIGSTVKILGQKTSVLCKLLLIRPSCQTNRLRRMLQLKFLPPSKHRRRGRSFIPYLGSVCRVSTTGRLKNYASRGSVSSLDAYRWHLVPKKASGPSFPFAQVGFRSVLSYHQAGGGHPNQRGRDSVHH